MTNRKFTFRLAIAALAGLCSSIAVKASALVTLTVEASTTGQAGSYSATLASKPTVGSTLYYEIVAQSAPTSAVNINTTKTPNATTDSIVSLPNFTLNAGSGAAFVTSALQNNFNTGSGASGGTTGASTIDIRAIEQGFTLNDDAALVVDSGTVTVGSNFTGITANTDLPVANAGSIRVAGSPVAVTNTTESSTDPLVGYSNLAVQAPEPGSLAMILCASPLLVRRRRAGA